MGKWASWNSSRVSDVKSSRFKRKGLTMFYSFHFDSFRLSIDFIRFDLIFYYYYFYCYLVLMRDVWRPKWRHRAFWHIVDWARIRRGPEEKLERIAHTDAERYRLPSKCQRITVKLSISFPKFCQFHEARPSPSPSLLFQQPILQRILIKTTYIQARFQAIVTLIIQYKLASIQVTLST